MNIATEPSLLGAKGSLRIAFFNVAPNCHLATSFSSLLPYLLAYPSFLGTLVGRHETFGAGLTISSTPFSIPLLNTFLHQENGQENSHSKYVHWINVFNFMVPVPHIGFSKLLVFVLDDQI